MLKTTREAAAQYVALGWKLCPIEPGTKGPKLKDWPNKPIEPSRLREGQGVGLIHTLSGTCAIDLDQVDQSSYWLDAKGIDLNDLLAADDAVQITSGKQNSGKLLYRLPDGVAPLGTKKIELAGKSGIEFRCAPVNGNGIQDVLPPTVHPDTHKCYEWAGAGDFEQLPPLPDSILALWKNMLDDAPNQKAYASKFASNGGIEVVSDAVIEDLRSALKYLCSDPRDVWVSVCHALHSIGEAGFKLWDEWSQTSAKYDPVDLVRVWFSAHHERTSYQSVFKKAQAAGWVNPNSRKGGNTIVLPKGVKSWTDPETGEVTYLYADNSGDVWTPPKPPEPCMAKDEKPEDVVEFDLTYPPGLAGEIAQYIFDTSRMPVKSFAVAGALQTLSYLNGNKSWVESANTALNLYQCLSGQTGSGKEGPRQAIKRILAASMLHAGGVCESVASAPALLRALETAKEQLILTDEFGLFLQIAISDKGSAHLKELIKELMTLYGLGRSSYAGKIYADAIHNIGNIEKPYVSVFGTTTPLELVDGISQKAVDNGFLNRILFIQASAANPINRSACVDVPTSLIKGIGTVLDTPYGGMKWEPEAHDYMVRCAEGMNEPGRFKNLWMRAEEQMIRVAGLLAVGDGGVIKCSHVTWACQYVTHSIKSFSTFLGEDLAETVFQKLVAKASKFIRGARQYSTDKQFGAACKAGFMPRSKLLKLMKLPARDMDDVVKYLIESGTFEQGFEHGFAILFDKA